MGSRSAPSLHSSDADSPAPTDASTARRRAPISPTSPWTLAARRASALRLELEAAGAAIGMADYLIAACCLAHSAELLTRNRSHFERPPGLRLA